MLPDRRAGSLGKRCSGSAVLTSCQSCNQAMAARQHAGVVHPTEADVKRPVLPHPPASCQASVPAARRLCFTFTRCLLQRTHDKMRRQSHSRSTIRVVVQATIALIPDGTVAIEVDICSVLLQWPFLTDISLGLAAASIFQAPQASADVPQDPAQAAAVQVLAVFPCHPPPPLLSINQSINQSIN